ncbi:MAG: hypothetical protein HY541_01320 [Deltaproteobacteria bacterium]|nr:hypothetical protein [Deltaproteobacteria bacterium]
MYLQNVKNIAFFKGLNYADLARLAAVSRATVTKWYKQGEKRGWVNTETASIIRMAESLKLPADLFLQKRPLLSRYRTPFLWDALYPDMESFVKALSEFRLPAVARLVQVLGFHESSALLGKKVILHFEHYKKYIKPARRKQLEILWSLYAS